MNDSIDERCDAFIAELNSNSVVSRSHITLRYLYKDFGEKRVEKILNRKLKEIADAERWEKEYQYIKKV